MKQKVIYEIIFFIISICTSFICLGLSYNSEVQDIIRTFIKFLPSNIPNYTWYIRVIILAIALFIGLVYIRFVRFISNSKNINTIKNISNYILFLIVGLPITHIILLFDLPFDIKNTTGYIIVYCLTFYVICRIIMAIFIASYYKILEKPLKNCRVVICKPTSSTTFEEISVFTKNLTFMECHSCIRSYAGDDLNNKEFFKIEEVNHSGKIIDSWNYYKTGENIDNLDEYLTKCYTISTNINWGY